MKIFIHTYGRVDRQITYRNLPNSIRERTQLVIQQKEFVDRIYPEGIPVLVLPEHITRLGPTRQWLMETFPTEKIVILDDDLEFAVRRDDDRTRFLPADDRDIEKMFEAIFYILDHFALVGVAAREGANRNTEPTLLTTRQMRIHGIDAKVYNQLGIRFDRVDVMEDFDVTLQFLEAGYPNLVLNNWVTNQGGSNTAGGCSHYRTLEVQSASAHRLAELHPGFVSVIRKQTRTSWGGQPRDDVIVQWKKAYSAGKSRLLDKGEGESKTPERIGST